MYNFETIQTQHGRFDNSSDLTKTAKEVYQKHLDDKNNPTTPPANKIDILEQQMIDANSMIIDLEFRFLMSSL